MSILDSILDKSVDFLFNETREIQSPTFLKDFSEENQQLNDLIALSKKLYNEEKLIKNLPIKSLVVISNPQTIIDKQRCPKAVADLIYRYDQIISTLKNFQNDKNNTMNAFESNLYKIANFLLSRNKPIIIDYKTKYGITDDDYIPKCPHCKIKMVERTSSKKGNKFWGCHNYPKCRTIINMN